MKVVIVTSPSFPSWSLSLDLFTFESYESLEQSSLSSLQQVKPNASASDLKFTNHHLFDLPPITSNEFWEFVREYNELSPKEAEIVDVWLANNKFSLAGSAQAILHSFVSEFDSVCEYAKELYEYEIDERFHPYVDWGSLGYNSIDEDQNVYLSYSRVYRFTNID
jgi:hypothetical protein